ncbi:MAG: MBL fold metallo-hydrolase [bacterium]
MEQYETGDTVLRWHGHSSISMAMPGTRVYVDPYRLFGQWPDASYVFITHPHHDHLDETSLKKISNEETTIVAPVTVDSEQFPVPKQNMIRVHPGEMFDLPDRPIRVYAVPAYNPDKRFHPKENEWVGYIIQTSQSRFYHAGDTGPVEIDYDDDIDLAMVPVDGVYTMEAREAAFWIDRSNVKNACPIHYGTDRGTETDALTFRNNLSQSTPVRLESTRLIV